MHEITEFKGHPIIVLKRSEDDYLSIQFGTEKAKLILENIKAIVEFVKKHDKEYVADDIEFDLEKGDIILEVKNENK